MSLVLNMNKSHIEPLFFVQTMQEAACLSNSCLSVIGRITRRIDERRSTENRAKKKKNFLKDSRFCLNQERRLLT